MSLCMCSCLRVRMCTVFLTVLYSQVCERPIMHLLDTPGVLPPKIESVETGMKLALCGEQNRIFVIKETPHGHFVLLYSEEFLPHLSKYLYIFSFQELFWTI